MTLSKAEQEARDKARAEREALRATEQPPATAPQEPPADTQPETETEGGYQEYAEQEDGALEEANGEPQPLPLDARELDPLAADTTTVPVSADEEESEEEAPVEPQPGDEPLPKEYVVLNGPASYGPVRVGGKLIRCLKNKLYYVPDPTERADVLGTGRFRAATKADLARASAPSAGPGGALTRDLLPPGAIKGGLVRP